MKVSVITPTFDAAEHIEGCIKSVADQSYPEFEHLVMDGGSRDGTAEKVRDLCTRYRHLRLVSEKDNGIYDAMNKGLALASGDYIIFLGADDRFAGRNVLATVFDSIGEERPEVIYGSVRVVGNGIKGVADGEVYGGEFSFQQLLHKNICHQAIFYSRSMVERAGPYNIKYRFFADWDYNLRCYSLGKFRYVDVIVSRYNTRGRSATGEDNAFHASFFEEVRRYFGISVFSRHYSDFAGYLGFSGKLRLRQMKDKKGLVYLAAACWHSPRYFFEQVGSVSGKLLGRRV